VTGVASFRPVRSAIGRHSGDGKVAPVSKVGVFAQAKSGLGTSIVNALAQQLDAKVEVLSRASGTVVSVSHSTFCSRPRYDPCRLPEADQPLRTDNRLPDCD
jgi:hypothetical protein